MWKYVVHSWPAKFLRFGLTLICIGLGAHYILGLLPSSADSWPLWLLAHGWYIAADSVTLLGVAAALIGSAKINDVFRTYFDRIGSAAAKLIVRQQLQNCVVGMAVLLATWLILSALPNGPLAYAVEVAIAASTLFVCIVMVIFGYFYIEIPQGSR